MSGRRLVRWGRWETLRVHTLCREGLDLHLARRIAKAERATRQKLGSVIGWRAARSAELRCVPEGASLKFFLTGSLSGLTADCKARLFDLRNASAIIEGGLLSRSHII